MQELRVSKRQVPIEVMLPTGERRKVAVFLSDFASTHTGRERVSELLKANAFLPAEDPTRGGLVLFHCANLAVVRVAREEEAGEDASADTIRTEQRVEVTLSTGHTLSGLLQYVMPPERTRLSDYLNACPAFIPLLEQDQVALINRTFVAQITPVGP